MKKVDPKEIGLIHTLGTALNAVGAVCTQIAKLYDVVIPAPSIPVAEATPKPRQPKAATPKKGTRLLKTPKRKVNDDDHAAVKKMLSKATGRTARMAARDKLCRERGLTRRQVNGILMTHGEDLGKDSATSKKQLPTKPRRVVNEIDRHAAIKLYRETSKEAWPAARDALCIRSGLTRKQVAGILAVAAQLKNGKHVGRPKAKATNKK